MYLSVKNDSFLSVKIALFCLGGNWRDLTWEWKIFCFVTNLQEQFLTGFAGSENSFIHLWSWSSKISQSQLASQPGRSRQPQSSSEIKRKQTPTDVQGREGLAVARKEKGYYPTLHPIPSHSNHRGQCHNVTIINMIHSSWNVIHAKF